MPQYSSSPRRPDNNRSLGRERRFFNANQRPGGVNIIRHEESNPEYVKSPVLRILTANTTITLNAADLGKTILSSTNHKHITIPTPVNNSGMTLSVISGITRNTTLQCVNGTAGKFGIIGDSAVNSVRIQFFAERLDLYSTGVDWIVSAYANTTIVPNASTTI